MAEEASPELALKAAEELLKMQRNRIRELEEDRDRLLTVSRELIRRGPNSAAWAPFFDAVAEIEQAWKPPALGGRDG